MLPGGKGARGGAVLDEVGQAAQLGWGRPRHESCMRLSCWCLFQSKSKLPKKCSLSQRVHPVACSPPSPTG